MLNKKITVLKQLYSEKKLDIQRIIRYLIVGVLTTAVSFSLFWIFAYPLNIETNVANLMSIMGAIVFAYVTNKIYVYRSKTNSKAELLREAVSFVASRGLTILLEIGGVFLLATVLHYNKMFSKAAISILVIIANYIISQYFVFNQ